MTRGAARRNEARDEARPSTFVLFFDDVCGHILVHARRRREQSRSSPYRARAFRFGIRHSSACRPRALSPSSSSIASPPRGGAMCAALRLRFASIPIVASTSSAPPSAPTAAMSISAVVRRQHESDIVVRGVFPLRPVFAPWTPSSSPSSRSTEEARPAARSSSESSTAPMGEPFFEYNTSPRRGPGNRPGSTGDRHPAHVSEGSPRASGECTGRRRRPRPDASSSRRASPRKSNRRPPPPLWSSPRSCPPRRRRDAQSDAWM